MFFSILLQSIVLCITSLVLPTSATCTHTHTHTHITHTHTSHTHTHTHTSHTHITHSQLKSELLSLREQLLPIVQSQAEKGLCSHMFLRLFTTDLRQLEEEGRNKVRGASPTPLCADMLHKQIFCKHTTLHSHMHTCTHTHTHTHTRTHTHIHTHTHAHTHTRTHTHTVSL